MTNHLASTLDLMTQEQKPEDTGPRHPYQRIAADLRDAIAVGVYGPGEKIPSQTELVETHGTTRETVRRALDLLRSERLITTRQGAGSYVRPRSEHPSELRPHMEAAFHADKISIDFMGFSAETLFNSLAEPLDKVRRGTLSPRELTIRLIVCDMTAPVPWPAAAGPDVSDEDARARMARITDRSIQAIRHTASELPGAAVEVRSLATPPLVKLLILNKAEAWCGWYVVVRRQVIVRGEQVEILDAKGKDATLWPYTVEDEAGAAWIDGAQTWFDALWNVAQVYE